MGLFLGLFCFGWSAYAYTQASSYPSTMLHLTQHNYSGERHKSFGASAQGYSAGVTLMTQYEYFVPFIGINVGSQSGRQAFLDRTTSITSNYTYQYGGGEAGLLFFPLGRKDKGLNLYMKGSGIAGYQTINLKTNATLTTLPTSDQNFSTGYKGHFGLELILSKRAKARWTIYAEIGFKNETTQLLKQNFNLDSLNYTMGLGW